MAETFEKCADTGEFGRDVRRRAIVAPFVRQSNFEARRITLDLLLIGLRRRPERHELAGCSAAARVDESSRIAHRPRLATLDRHEAAQVRQMRRDREHAARHLEADIAVDPGRDADRAAAVGRVCDWHRAGRHHRRGVKGEDRESGCHEGRGAAEAGEVGLRCHGHDHHRQDR